MTWWQLTVDDANSERSCILDDQIMLNADGSFAMNHGAEAWLEADFHGIEEDSCGAPMSPYDNESTGYTWSISTDTTKLTVNGIGAYIGLPNFDNNGDITWGNPAQSITYDIVSYSDTTMQLGLYGPDLAWQFNLKKSQ